jgi:hypothetical protein
MQAIEAIGTIDTKGHLKLAQPLKIRNKMVKIIIMIADVEDVIEEADWANDLSSQQRLELKTALAECENPTKLKAHEEVVKMSRQMILS